MSDLTGRRILLTGATGFIGANLARALVQGGAEAHALVRPRPDLWRIADLVPRLALHHADIDACEAMKEVVSQVLPEAIFHLAAPGGHPQGPGERAAMLRTVVLGTHNLLEAAATTAYRRFVHLCSSTVYGQRRQPLAETDPLEPASFRGAAKAAAALLCQQHARSQGRPIVVLRPFSVYGYWEAATRLVPTAILAALGEGEMRLTIPGLCRDLVFVPDVVEACLLALEADDLSGEAINLGSGQQWSNEAVVEWVRTLTGRRIHVQAGAYPAQAADSTHWVADIRAAKARLGWAPRHTLPEGLEKTIAWFRQHLDAYPR